MVESTNDVIRRYCLAVTTFLVTRSESPSVCLSRHGKQDISTLQLCSLFTAEDEMGLTTLDIVNDCDEYV